MNTKSYFCHNSIYDGSYPIPLSLSCCLKYIGLKTKSNFALEIRYLQHFTMVSKRAVLSVYGMLCRYLFISMKGKLMVYYNYIVFFGELLFFASEC